jgi:hypothetical protein
MIGVIDRGGNQYRFDAVSFVTAGDGDLQIGGRDGVVALFTRGTWVCAYDEAHATPPAAPAEVSEPEGQAVERGKPGWTGIPR